MSAFDYFIVTDAPSGPRLLFGVHDARLWLERGFDVVRVAHMESVTTLGLAIEEAEAQMTGGAKR